MRENDELTDIPSIVPSRDDVDTHRQNRKGQAQEIVRPGHYTERVKVSTWPVRIMLGLLSLAVMAGGGGAYYFLNNLYQEDLLQADLRISDLERRLALVGNSSEETALNIQETLDFHFSEIDKLWATRNSINSTISDVRSEIARVALVNEGQDEAAANLSKQLSDTGIQISASETRLNTLVNEFDQVNRSLTALNSSVANLQALESDMQAIRATLNSGDSTVVGLIGRLEYMEESLESINAHRLQINESLFRLQENIEAVERMVNPAGPPR
ncbi:MAG: hypothetical protein WD772_00375 [Pseudohongiellaceae bacterium]